jgi:hypothetical protein
MGEKAELPPLPERWIRQQLQGYELGQPHAERVVYGVGALPLTAGVELDAVRGLNEDGNQEQQCANKRRLLCERRGPGR